jgi:AcrR family transcriptional regulator
MRPMSSHETSVSSTVSGAEVRTVDGRVLGRRGRRTRERLLTATADLLASRAYRDVTVADIARRVETSPGTFYQYFPSVEAAVHLLAQRAAAEGETLVGPVLTGAWDGPGARGAARALVDAFLEVWRRHAPVLRVVDLAIVEGDRRFRDIRDDLLGPVTTALVDVIVRRRELSLDDARAEAVILVSMLANVAGNQGALDAWGAEVGAARQRLAEHTLWGVAGHHGAQPSSHSTPRTAP